MKKPRRNKTNHRAGIEQTKTTPFPIVGIGGSAGGLEAFQALLKALSPNLGMAYVFIMHLTPTHKSMLADILAKATTMPVNEATDGITIKKDQVYVIPPNTSIRMKNSRLTLSDRKDSDTICMPIDRFFTSLATEQGNRAIGVILSGTASDGTLGAEAIKAEGGITFAQDSDSAKYDSMPSNVVNAGCADFVLSPPKIAAELEHISKHPVLRTGIAHEIKPTTAAGDDAETVFDILRQEKGVDFTYYKSATITRRIERRMVLLKLRHFKEYVRFLQTNKNEVNNLYEDLLINVTSFFRDPKVFEAITARCLATLGSTKNKGQLIKIWVPGCSSGEEAYSIAICVLEALGKQRGSIPVQIFATDVSEKNISKARRGVYSNNIKDALPPAQLKRFFTKEGDVYRVSRQLREMCIFSRHNILSDPPFSNVDLIAAVT